MSSVRLPQIIWPAVIRPLTIVLAMLPSQSQRSWGMGSSRCSPHESTHEEVRQRNARQIPLGMDLLGRIRKAARN